MNAANTALIDRERCGIRWLRRARSFPSQAAENATPEDERTGL
jgi:hypothetical protein